MSKVVKKRTITDVSQLQSLVADHVEGIEPGLAVLDSRLLLGQATMDVIALDAHGTLVLMAVAFTADEEMLLRAVEAYSWSLEYPEAIRRLYPSAQISPAQPPRLVFVIERMPDSFHRKIKQLGFPEVDCVEVRVLDVDGSPAVFFDTLARLRRGPAATPAPAPVPERVSPPAAPVITARPTSVKLQKLLGGERSGAGREPGQVVSLLNRAVPRHEPAKPVVSAPKVGGAVVPRLVDPPPAPQPRHVVEAFPTPVRAIVHIVESPITVESKPTIAVAPRQEPMPAPPFDAVAAAFAEPIAMAELELASMATDEPTFEADSDAEPELARRLEGPAAPALRLLDAPTSEPTVTMTEREPALEPASALDPEPVLMLASDPESTDESELTVTVVAEPELTLVGEAEPEPILTLESDPGPELTVASASDPDSELTLTSVPDPDPELTLEVAAQREPGPTFEPTLTLVSDPEPVLMLESSVQAEPLAASEPEPLPVPRATPSVFSRRTPEPADRKVSFADVAKDLLTVTAQAKAASTTPIGGRRSVEEVTRAAVSEQEPAVSAFAKPGTAVKRPRTIAPPSQPDPNPIAGISKPASKRAVAEPDPAPVATPATPAIPAAVAEPTPASDGEQPAPQGFEGVQFPNDGVLTRQWMEFLNQMAAGR